MRTSGLAAGLTTAAICVAAMLFAGAAAAASDGKGKASGLGNASCLSCHGDKQKKVEVPGANGENRVLRAVNAGRFAESVHSDLECIACHREINDSTAPHRKTPGESRPDCAQCHLDIARILSTFKTPKTSLR